MQLNSYYHFSHLCQQAESTCAPLHNYGCCKEYCPIKLETRPFCHYNLLAEQERKPSNENYKAMLILLYTNLWNSFTGLMKNSSRTSQCCEFKININSVK